MTTDTGHHFDPLLGYRGAIEGAVGQVKSLQGQGTTLARVAGHHMDRIARDHGARATAAAESAQGAARAASAADPVRAFADYLVDAGQRYVLTLDTLRERGDIFLAHEAAGCPPVLGYGYDIVMDGAALKRPCNYFLLRIRPPEGCEVLEWKRPYIIIDPRAGHGAGIGGFKPDSQVGVAIRDGHPVYFVAFRPEPEPGQTISDVTRAEAAFVKEVQRLHPDSAKPIVIGNCQGGWASLLLAATNPDLAGPIVVNGAPVATWSGEVGDNPMRYLGGVTGGVLPAMIASDLGGGKFDGANLVMNFESDNPARTWFRKYYDIFSTIDRPGARARFLEFEKWWGGYFLMNEAEIRWIVEQLFVGNLLSRNEARLEHGRSVDLKTIRSPVIVFASHGDNITPPQQALNWIVDTYADENEIKLHGQRIIYMVHEKVGHLGIFVSSSIARREHSEMASTMKTIEALAPGLYEMVIEDVVGEGVDARFYVSFAERRMADITALDDGREDERPFAAVARLSSHLSEAYDAYARPLVRAAVNPALAEEMRAYHPMRAQRWMISGRNPLLGGVRALADQARAERRPVDEANPFLQMERFWARSVENTLDLWRDMRKLWLEWTFFTLYDTPMAESYGAPQCFSRTRKDPEELRALPQVQSMLARIEEGGFAEAVIRMLILLAEARGEVRRSRLERSARVLTLDEPFRSLGPVRRSQIIHEQTIVAQFEADRAIAALADMLPQSADRDRAIAVVEYVLGPIEEMDPNTFHLLQRFREALGLTPVPSEIPGEDPLADAPAPGATPAA